MSATPKRTTQDAADIFDGLVDALKEVVTQGEVEFVKDAEGNKVAVRKTISPAMANVVRQFLNDQRIQATPANKGLSALAKAAASQAPFQVPGEDDFDPNQTYQ